LADTILHDAVSAMRDLEDAGISSPMSASISHKPI
jgi:hypothetical protein